MDLKQLKETLGELAELKQLEARLCGDTGKNTPSLVVGMESAYDRFMGKGVFVRTATYHLIGVLSEQFGSEIVLTKASTVFSSGNFGNALATGKLSEVEAHPTSNHVVVPKGAIIDVTDYPHIGA